jgi:hypothetical protein
MLYDYGITPGLFDSGILHGSADVARDLVRVLEGLCENGLVGDVCDGHLRPMIGRTVTALPPGQLRDELRVCLEVLDKRQRFVVRPYVGPGWPETDVEWLDEVLAAHGQEAFYAIITLGATLGARTCPPCALPIGSVWQSPLWRDRVTSRRLGREAAVFGSVLRPVLRHARSLMLIDPHIQPTEPRYYRSLQALIRTAYDRPDPTSLKVFEIHARAAAHAPSTYAWFEGGMRSQLTSLIPGGCRVRSILWAEMRPSLHNRFVLANFCGISVDMGLDESTIGPDKDDWQLLSESHRAEVWTHFQKRVAPYLPVHEFDIP